MSRKAFLPSIFVPNAQKLTDADGKQMFDRKGRQLWNMPVPSGMTRHFKSAGMRRKYEAGKATLEEATKVVPIYRGFDMSLTRVIRATMKYRERQEKRRQARAAQDAALLEKIEPMIADLNVEDRAKG